MITCFELTSRTRLTRMRSAPSPIDEHLALLASAHHDAGVPIPPLLDVTGADPDAVDAVRALPTITFARVASPLPPRESGPADLAVPAASVAALSAAVARNPTASLVVVQLIRATARLPIHDALAMESLAYSMLQAGTEYRSWLARRGTPERLPDPAPRVRITGEPGRTILCLDRPDHANALDTQARHELVDALTALRHSDDEIVLRGAGPHFCAGGDLDEFSSPSDVTATHHLRLRQGVASSVARVRSRLRAEVHGGVIGAGVELSAFAQHVSASPDARFRLPEVRMGLLPGSGGSVSLPRRIGPNRALNLMLTGAVLDAGTALTWGLVDEVRA